MEGHVPHHRSCKYKLRLLTFVPLRGTKFNERGVIGGAYTDQMCDPRRSSNVNFDTKGGQDVPYLATLIAHEIGHVMGMFHDTDPVRQNEYDTCDCPC